MEDDEEKLGNYRCQGCGSFFTASISMQHNCPECLTPQTNMSVWDQVISRRENQLAFDQFEKKEKKEKSKTLLKLEEDADVKLDIVGRQRAKKRAIALAIGALWVIGVIGIVIKVSQKDNNRDAKANSIPDGSISPERYKENTRIAEYCFKVLNKFLRAPDIVTKSKLVYNADEEILDTYYSSDRRRHVPIVTAISNFHRMNDDIMVIHCYTESGNKRRIYTEAIFVRSGNKWLLDWKNFSNFEDMEFEDYLDSKPVGIHEFRVHARSSAYANKRTVTFLATEPNNLQFSPNIGGSQTLTFDKNHPLWLKINETFKKAETYRFLNHTQNASNEDIMATKDPLKTYRLRATFEYVREEQTKKFTLRDIKAIHWLDDYYKEFSTPAQSRTERLR